MVSKASRENSGGGDGIQVIKNEPFEKDGMKGQYTFKVYIHFIILICELSFHFSITENVHCLQSACLSS